MFPRDGSWEVEGGREWEKMEQGEEAKVGRDLRPGARLSPIPKGALEYRVNLRTFPGSRLRFSHSSVW